MRTYIMGALALALAFTAAASAQDAAPRTFTDAVRQVTSRPVYRHANFGLEVFDLDQNKVLFALNADKLFTPGSTTKIFTEGAALTLLGADYRFHTPLYRTGKVSHGTLNGNLVLVGSGDPNLSDRLQPDGSLAWTDEDHTYGGADSKLIGTDPAIVLHQLAKAVADAGIKRVKGKVVVDVSLFPEGARDLGTGETISPIIVNDNAIDILYAPGAAVGDPARIVSVTPAVPYIRFVNKIVTVAGAKAGLDSHVTKDNKDGTQTVTLSGTIGLQVGQVVYAYALAKPSRFAGVLLTAALKQAGVKVSGRPDAITDLAAHKSYGDEMRVAEHVSTPLTADVRLTLKVSQNLHASIMPYVMGAVLGHATDKIDQKGFQLEHDFLAGAGLDLTGASQSDGAGGAGVAFYTPDFAARYLVYMARRPDYELFRSDLPILGKDGTLWDIQKDSPGAGHVFAKTGTYGGRDYLNSKHLTTGKGLTGYTTTTDGRHLAFAFYVNNVELSEPSEVSDSTMTGQALGEMASALYALPL